MIEIIYIIERYIHMPIIIKCLKPGQANEVYAPRFTP